MTDTTTANTLARNLRLAADLCEQLGWDQGITWSGTDTLGLHCTGAPDAEIARTTAVSFLYNKFGDADSAMQYGDDYRLRNYQWTTPDGLSVVLYGPRRPLTEDGGAA